MRKRTPVLKEKYSRPSGRLLLFYGAFVVLRVRMDYDKEEGGESHGYDKNRRTAEPFAKRAWHDPEAGGGGAADQRPYGLQMGTGCFPNKKILRNSPCLPACKQKNIATRLRDTT